MDACMTMMIPTPIPWDFHHTAKAIVAAQTQGSNKTTIPYKSSLLASRGCGYESSLSSLNELNHWVIEHTNPGGGIQQLHYHPDADSDYSIYLAHPPILLTFLSNNNSGSPPSTALLIDQYETEIHAWQLDDSDGGCNSIVDDIMVEEIPATITPTPTTRSIEYTEWSFSILMHKIWRVPTLYFSCCHSDGTPLCRREVLDMLLQSKGMPKADVNTGRGEEQNGTNDNDDDDESLWEFVSQEEHPMTGQPSYFLHPCRTAERMEIMLSYRRHHHQLLGQHNSKSKQSEERESEDVEAEHQIIPLLSWMSMVLPVVGCKISPEVYCRVRHSLLATTQQEASM